MNLDTKLYHFPGIGNYYATKLAALGVVTFRDLIYHFPFRYDDFSNVSNALEAQEGEKVTLIGEIWSIKNIYTRTGKTMTQAVFNDGTAPITLSWFNQSWLTNQIKTGDRLQISGKLTKYKGRLSIMAPVWEKQTNNNLTQIVSNNSLHTGRLVPVYPETEGLTSKWIRTRVSQILPLIQEFIEDPLPESVRDGMLPLLEAIKKVHFPDNLEDAEQARERLGFDELFFIQLATLKARLEWGSQPSIEKLNIQHTDLEPFYKNLPFTLTDAQIKVINEIIEDLNKSKPMNRLVQGEVGSGKTIVAAAIMYLLHTKGYRSLYMAPTEILAFQHHTNLSRVLAPLGITIGIYTGSRKEIEKQEDGKLAHIIVGTHALLSDKLLSDNIGLVVVDEQQRFGVEQRSILRSKAKIPHFLTMTATPIPRTVALTIYGDLDVSRIDQLPKGRQEIKTHVVPNKKRADAYKFIADHIKERDQAYIITPLIEESETMQTVKAATTEYERLQKDVFPKFRLGLLHGRLKPKEKEEVLNDFKDGKIDILVSTSVVEVGVDVPNATFMVIESAERFGLAQLHQLRGRVGRGVKQSYCLLFSEGEQAVSRLKNMESINDGLKLAELDLKIRGSGEIFGTRQSGRFELKIASFSDLDLIEKSRSAASKILSEDNQLDKYPSLKAKLQSLGTAVMPD